MAETFTCILVDDDRDFIELEKLYLAESCPDVRVIPFTSAEEAMAYVRTHHIDLVVTDFKMPTMNGVELTGIIRSFDERVPILLVSENEVRESALAAGASAFVRKDIFRRNHRAIIDELLVHRAATQRRSA
jgi:CheY-like chemotaxis protein